MQYRLCDYSPNLEVFFRVIDSLNLLRGFFMFLIFVCKVHICTCMCICICKPVCVSMCLYILLVPLIVDYQENVKNKVRARFGLLRSEHNGSVKTLHETTEMTEMVVH